MSEHEKHTAFLSQCLLYDESTRRHHLVKEIARIQRDLRCVGRAVWLMAMLVLLVVAFLGYGTVLVRNFPYNESQFTVKLIFALGVGFLISLLAFPGLWIVYRWKLDLRREECRRMVAKLLESRLGKPVAIPLQDSPADVQNTQRMLELIETEQESSAGGIEQGK